MIQRVYYLFLSFSFFSHIFHLSSEINKDRAWRVPGSAGIASVLPACTWATPHPARAVGVITCCFEAPFHQVFPFFLLLFFLSNLFLWKSVFVSLHHHYHNLHLHHFSLPSLPGCRHAQIWLIVWGYICPELKFSRSCAARTCVRSHLCTWNRNPFRSQA